jgi:7,8-dihydroneopterin aldolase/epimerase/oxygenase
LIAQQRKRTNVDKLFVRDLRVEAIIGFWEWERRVKQIVSIDLEIATDSKAAASVDEVEAALNYERLSERVLEFVGASQFKLVETLAEAIARIVVSEFGAAWVKVSVAKPGAIPRAREVGIVIERRTGDFG